MQAEEFRAQLRGAMYMGDAVAVAAVLAIGRGHGTRCNGSVTA